MIQLTCRECYETITNEILCFHCKDLFCQQCDSFYHQLNENKKHQTCSVNQLFFQKNDFVVMYFSKEFYKRDFLELRGIQKLIFEYTYKLMISHTQQGSCILSKSFIISSLKNHFQDLIPSNSDFLENTLFQNKLFYDHFILTKRKFGQENSDHYFSIKLQYISIEAIISIIQSIRLLKMEPNQVTIHSKLKEYFGLQITMKSWNEFIQQIHQNISLKKGLNLQEEYFGRLQIKFRNGIFLLKPKNLNWEYEDTININSQDEDFILFRKKLYEFFEKKEHQNFKFVKTDYTRWMFSKNVKKNETENHNLVSLMQEKEIENAIPGGKYGCAMVLNYHYPSDFQNISFGKMVSMVKHVLSQFEFCHYKTLIYKNPEFSNLKHIKNDMIKNQIKNELISLVQLQKGNGISLSQLPQVYEDTFNKKLEFQQFGYAKLKNMIEEMDSIKIVKNNNNHLQVFSKEYYLKQKKQQNYSNRKLSQYNKSIKLSKKSTNSKFNDYCSNQKNINKNMPIQKTFSNDYDRNQQKRRRKQNHYSQYGNSINFTSKKYDQRTKKEFFQNQLDQILNENPHGISLNLLRKQVKLAYQSLNFDWKWCSSEFTLFLVQDGERLGIVVQKQIGINGEEIPMIKKKLKPLVIRKDSIQSFQKTNRSDQNRSEEFNMWSGFNTPPNKFKIQQSKGLKFQEYFQHSSTQKGQNNIPRNNLGFTQGIFNEFTNDHFSKNFFDFSNYGQFFPSETQLNP